MNSRNILKGKYSRWEIGYLKFKWEKDIARRENKLKSSVEILFGNVGSS